MGVVEPDVLRSLQPAGATRVTLDVIIPSPRSLTPENWKLTATLCPLDWPSNYSLLRLWHVPKDLHQFVDQLKQQMNVIICSLVGRLTMTSLRVESSISSRPHYLPEATSWQQRLRPCVGLCPLHHAVGVVHVPLAAALRYSLSGDPESP